MQNSIQSGDPVAPVVASHVVGIAEVNGVICRIDFVTNSNQPRTDATPSPNYILTAAQARSLATTLLDAAKVVEDAAAARAGAPKH